MYRLARGVVLFFTMRVWSCSRSHLLPTRSVGQQYVMVLRGMASITNVVHPRDMPQLEVDSTFISHVELSQNIRSHGCIMTALYSLPSGLLLLSVFPALVPFSSLSFFLETGFSCQWPVPQRNSFDILVVFKEAL